MLVGFSIKSIWNPVTYWRLHAEPGESSFSIQNKDDDDDENPGSAGCL